MIHGAKGIAGHKSRSRLAGLDLARYFALAGMVFVNFRQAMHPASEAPGWLLALFHFLEGKASATFVVLAGLGLVLATRSQERATARIWTLRRALFLLVAGGLNLLIFPADIIHYYAVYFVLAIAWLQTGPRALLAGILGVALASTWALLHLDYSQGWDWASLSYEGLWEPAGFARNLLFNGFHPVLPWFAFFLYGMLLARLPLAKASVQGALVAAGAAMSGLACALAWLGGDGPWAPWLATSPMPPGPAYLLMGLGCASIAIGACLRLAERWPEGPWRGLLPAGRMTLTLYLAHILIGMGILEAMGALDGTRGLGDVAWAATLYLLMATVAAWAWGRKVAQGPVEWVMRRLTAVG
ncbi:Predicted membrane protein [Delftia tsuruhatensis]|uniref:DUF418 domain-containing protein n=1 Tax=Delftia tsuruhatensis TaxID=180282 RepID=UPI001E720F6C|nr:DUF418 domain-containing protein [Delftia tsuruhatensis]CAB5720448.1 Predicted membrane protein [Delftia tsuruhatensis]CAC9681545.1 Predicted membrane protein [Delftia tsuruhatensis]